MSEETKNIHPIVRHIKTGIFYKWEGGNKYTNLCTGISGEVPDEVAKKIFRINLPLTIMAGKNPLIEDLIKGLNLVHLN